MYDPTTNNASQVEGRWSAAMKWIVSVFGGLFGILLVLLAWSIWNKKRLARKHEIPPEVRRGLEARLLDFVRAGSGDRHESVGLYSFWRNESKSYPGRGGEALSSRVPMTVRTQVIGELIRQRHIELPDVPVRADRENQQPDSGFVESLLDMVGEMLSELGKAVWVIVKTGTAIPPKFVRLTDGTFDRMTHGVSGYTIIGGFVQHNEGTFVNSPPTMAGRNAKVSQKRVGNNLGEAPFNPEVLDRIVDVLRRDAEKAPQPYRDQMNDVASGIEREAGKDSPDEDEVISRLRRARRIIASAGTVFVASNEAVKAWFELKSHL
ncbi:hypothetical protein [Allobranchiibius huperziae]|uniref:Uncharacterized protein n=1 Tax=Allobranchiibius huperziae TaxID=1874116 RepID=A0A853DLP8_9MICO|nr:hypothetical protein [Allobranchiibius huperziae]NYJ75924.1 hypothetical protein [Allobranchiibius huperziae]